MKISYFLFLAIDFNLYSISKSTFLKKFFHFSEQNTNTI